MQSGRFDAFTYQSDDEAIRLWSKIPRDTDVLVTHTPPYGHLDCKIRRQEERSREGSSQQEEKEEQQGRKGCKILDRILGRNVRPLLAVCGHVHESRGYERIRWKDHHVQPLPQYGSVIDDDEHILGPELFTFHGIDLPPPGSKRQSLVDLTGRRGRHQQGEREVEELEALDNYGFSFSSRNVLTSSSTSESSCRLLRDDEDINAGGCDADRDQAIQSRRRESCIVNAAIMATSWPYKGGKSFHSAIIVDVFLPVWTQS